MKYVGYIFQVLFSDLFLCIRLLGGGKISFSMLSLVSPFSTIKTRKGKIRIGKKTTIRSNTEICASDGEILIGNGCFVNRNCMIVAHKKISIGDGTTIGPNVCIYDHDHNYKKDCLGDFVSKSVTIGRNVWIGANCTILKGIYIADDVVIAAGCVVTKSINTPKSLFYQKKNDFVITRE